MVLRVERRVARHGMVSRMLLKTRENARHVAPTVAAFVELAVMWQRRLRF